MSLQKREKILLALGSILLVSGLVLTQGGESQVVETSVSSLVGHDSEESAMVANHLSPTEALSKKDPFYSNISQTVATKIDTEVQAIPSLSLEGIFLDTRGYAALINGDVVHLGDKVANSLVVKTIERTRVILTNDGKDFSLDL